MASNLIGLDNPVFAGRLRTSSRRTVAYQRRAVESPRPRLIQDIRTATAVAKVQIAAPGKQGSALRPGTKRVVAQHHSPHSRITRSKVLKRSSVRVPKRKRRPRPRLSLKTAPLALAVVLFLFGLGVGIDGLRANKQVVAQVRNIQQNNTVADTADADDTGETGGDVAAAAIPDEDNRPDVDSYRVASDLPRALYIPKLDVKARVLHLGTTRDGAVATPSSIFDTGWYKESAKPGQPGALFIGGHVHGPIEKGVFANLKQLQPGDEVKLERGDGEMFIYEVVDSKIYPAESVDMGAALSSAQSGKQGLNLITCTGKLDSTTNSYKDRLVVFTVQK